MEIAQKTKFGTFDTSKQQNKIKMKKIYIKNTVPSTKSTAHQHQQQIVLYDENNLYKVNNGYKVTVLLDF